MNSVLTIANNLITTHAHKIINDFNQGLVFEKIAGINVFRCDVKNSKKPRKNRK